MAAKAVAYNRDFAVFAAFATAHVERVAAKTTNDLDGDLFARRLDEEPVVALECIDRELFDTGEGHEQASTKDAAVGDDEVVAELGTHDGECVEAVAAVDPNRCINRKGDEVSALATIDVGVRSVGIVRIDLDECPDEEAVIVFVTEEVDLGQVAVDGELVITEATSQRGAL